MAWTTVQLSDDLSYWNFADRRVFESFYLMHENGEADARRIATEVVHDDDGTSNLKMNGGRHVLCSMKLSRHIGPF
jgi:hypothetical protein